MIMQLISKLFLSKKPAEKRTQKTTVAYCKGHSQVIFEQHVIYHYL